jgi:hypothetical protein
MNAIAKITASDWDFPVAEQEIYDSVGNPITGHKHVVRTDTGESMGVHGSRYNTVPHADVIQSTLDAVKEANLSKDYDLTVDVYEGGRKLKGHILFNDLVTEPVVGDIVRYRVDILNSYDASWPYANKSLAERLACLNGMVSGTSLSNSTFKHTASINIEGAAAKLASGLDYFWNRKDEWQQMMNTSIQSDDVETFLKRTVCKAFTKQKQVTKTNEKQLENLLGIWKEEQATLGNNQWALYNCLTYWSSHTQELRAPHTARYNREIAVSNALNSKFWKELSHA